MTPEFSGAIHRFHDTSPFSPSGRFLALTRLPFEDRLPKPGDIAEIVLVDLQTGGSTVVAHTRGWDTQLGAHAQWGTDDRCLFYNDLDVRSWRPFGVRIDPLSGKQMRLDGTVYSISPDGRFAASPCLMRTAVTQRGYGVVVPSEMIPVNRGASPSDGISMTDTETGESRLLVSIERIVREVVPPLRLERYRDGDFFGFHLKWNPQGTRLMFVLRWLPRKRFFWRMHPGRMLKQVITMNADGSDIRLAVTAEQWSRGGHHPNWCPDGDHVLMNLNTHGDGLRFFRTRYDGETRETLAPSVRGSGHPTMHPDGRHLLTDSYPHESVAFGDGTIPIRWIDFGASTENTLIRIRTKPRFEDSSGALRVDPHPAWDQSYRRIAFNACPNGYRQVFVAQLA